MISDYRKNLLNIIHENIYGYITMMSQTARMCTKVGIFAERVGFLLSRIEPHMSKHYGKEALFQIYKGYIYMD